MNRSSGLIARSRRPGRAQSLVRGRARFGGLPRPHGCSASGSGRLAILAKMTGRDLLTGLVERVTLNSDEVRRMSASDGERLRQAGSMTGPPRLRIAVLADIRLYREGAARVGVNVCARSESTPPRLTP